MSASECVKRFSCEFWIVSRQHRPGHLPHRRLLRCRQSRLDVHGKDLPPRLQRDGRHPHLRRQVHDVAHVVDDAHRYSKQQCYDLQGEINYFTANQQRMDYPLYRSCGLPIGSGVSRGGLQETWSPIHPDPDRGCLTAATVTECTPAVTIH